MTGDILARLEAEADKLRSNSSVRADEIMELLLNRMPAATPYGVEHRVELDLSNSPLRQWAKDTVDKYSCQLKPGWKMTLNAGEDQREGVWCKIVLTFPQ